MNLDYLCRCFDELQKTEILKIKATE